MRKITIPILSTLITGLILSPVINVSAVINDSGTTWWSVPELLDYYTEVEAERIATCGDDFDCNMDFEMEHYENNEEYRALHNILEGQVWVTAINPTEETITVLFYDEDMMLKRMGIHENLELEHLYFGWFDEWNGQIYNYNHDSFTDGSMPDSHPLYDSMVEDLSMIKPWQEVVLSVAGGNLIDNPTGKIDYAAFAKENKFNAQGHFDYNACLRAEDYTYGAECHLMSSGDQGYSYFPPREHIAVEEMPIIELTAENSESNKAQETEGDIQNDAVTSNAASIQAPETGTATSGESSAVEFPWWLGAIIAVNGLTLIWLFLPIRDKTPKASSTKSTNKKLRQGTVSKIAPKSHFSTKKCIKTLDKNYQLR